MVSITWLKATTSAAPPPNEAGSSMRNRPASCSAAMTSGTMRRSASMRSLAASIIGTSAAARATQSTGAFRSSRASNGVPPLGVILVYIRSRCLSARAAAAGGWRAVGGSHNMRPQAPLEDTLRGIRIAITALLAMLAVAATISAALAQANFPARVVKLIVPYPPGGGTDLLARVLADQLGRKWG